MIRMTAAIEQVSISEQERLHDQHQTTIINQILQKLPTMDLPEQERVQCYMRHKWRLNHKPNSLRNSLKAIELFLTFYTSLGKSRLEEIVRDDLEAFVESEQVNSKSHMLIYQYDIRGTNSASKRRPDPYRD